MAMSDLGAMVRFSGYKLDLLGSTKIEVSDQNSLSLLKYSFAVKVN